MRNILSSCLAGAILVAGCNPIVEGDEGNLGFSYGYDDELWSGPRFGRPLAEGMEVDVRIHVSREDTKRLPVDGATTSDEEIVEIELAEMTFRMHGRSPGEAEVQVSANDLEDRFTVDVRTIERVEIEHPAALFTEIEPPLRVVAGEEIRFPTKLYDASDVRLIGFGEPPVAFEPEDAAAQSFGRYVAGTHYTFEQPGRVEMTGLGSDPIELEVVTIDDVETLLFEGLGEGPIEGSRVFEMRGGDADGNPIFGLEDTVSISTDDSSICIVEEVDWLVEGTHTLKVQESGECTLTAEIDTLEVTRTVEVVASE